MDEKITTLFWGVKGPFDLTLLPQSTSLGHFGNWSYMIKNIKGKEKKIVDEHNISRCGRGDMGVQVGESICII